MIDDQTKKALLAELAKSGNVFFACTKTNIARATYYRWRSSNRQFRTASDKALRHGRDNMVDIAEQALMQMVREKNFNAIKYVLGHNSRRYKSSSNPSQVIMRYVRDEPQPETDEEDPVERFFRRAEERIAEEKARKKNLQKCDGDD